MTNDFENGTQPRIWFIQPALPTYRLDFFARLSAHWGHRFKLFYSPGNLGALTAQTRDYSWAQALRPMATPFRGALWQPGVLSLPIRKGDTAIVCGNPRELTMLLLLLKGKAKGFRTIWFGNHWFYASSPLSYKVRIHLMKLADAVLFYTDLEIQRYRNGIGSGDKRPISAVNNGVDIAPIVAERRPYAAAQRPKELVYIGRLQSDRRFDILVRAMAKPELKDVRLNIIGDGDALGSFKALAQQLNAEDRFVWHGAMVDEKQIATVMNRSRLFVYPGPVGLSLLHGMSYGLPALVAIHEREFSAELSAAFSEGVTGSGFAMDSVDALADAVVRTVNNTNALDLWSKEALRRTDDIFNTRCMAENTIAFVERLESD
jgi:glycosyltransferase involved in cell wall biosynthesis